MEEIVARIKKWFESSSKKQKLVVTLLIFSLFAFGALLSLDSVSNVAGDPLDSTPFYFISAFVKLMAVLLLIVGSSVIFRRWIQTGPGGKAARQMRLLETIRFSPKQALHLVMIGDQKLLIGATDQNVSLISPIEDSLASVSSEEALSPSGLDFGSVIRSLNYSPDQSQEKE